MSNVVSKSSGVKTCIMCKNKFMDRNDKGYTKCYECNMRTNYKKCDICDRHKVKIDSKFTRCYECTMMEKEKIITEKEDIIAEKEKIKTGNKNTCRICDKIISKHFQTCYKCTKQKIITENEIMLRL